MSDGQLDEALACAIHRLPGLVDAIEEEFRRSEAFRALCEDLLVCAIAVTRWEASDAPAAPVRRQEYGQWLGELEAEIVDWLKAGTAHSPKQAGEER